MYFAGEECDKIPLESTMMEVFLRWSRSRALTFVRVNHLDAVGELLLPPGLLQHQVDGVGDHVAEEGNALERGHRPAHQEPFHRDLHKQNIAKYTVLFYVILYRFPQNDIISFKVKHHVLYFSLVCFKR